MGCYNRYGWCYNRGRRLLQPATAPSKRPRAVTLAGAQRTEHCPSGCYNRYGGVLQPCLTITSTDHGTDPAAMGSTLPELDEHGHNSDGQGCNPRRRGREQLRRGASTVMTASCDGYGGGDELRDAVRAVARGGRSDGGGGG
ncbi:hypothetical protein VPH35_083171 [Triticum aestivum]